MNLTTVQLKVEKTQQVPDCQVISASTGSYVELMYKTAVYRLVNCY